MTTPRSTLVSAFFVTVAALICAITSVSAQPSDSARFQHVAIHGLQANVVASLALLDSLRDERLTVSQRETRQKYFSRFRLQTPEGNDRIIDPVMAELYQLYVGYWRRALLDPAQTANAEAGLIDSLWPFLRRHDPALLTAWADSNPATLPEALPEFLAPRGLYGATGKTGPLFDLLVHARQTDTIYRIVTPEETLSVRVVFMDSVLSNGWEEYATFGVYYPGGWATNDALYCVRAAYDLNSENFLVSYLAHEGKHFADYQRFPKLEGADLEYRAKLVELALAQKSTYGLLKFFISNQSDQSDNAHGYGNACVVARMARALGGKSLGDNAEAWRDIPIEKIQKTAIGLLRESTESLSRAGADTVTALVTPE